MISVRLRRNGVADFALPGVAAAKLAAAGIAPEQAASLLAQAREAFMTGFRAVAALSVLGMLFRIAVTLSVLRDAKASGRH